MKSRLLTGIAATLLVLGPCFAGAQDQVRQGTKVPDSGAVQEGKRQSVANSTTDSSPAQTMQQAIAFERFKDMAAEREARKEAGKATPNTADRSKDDSAPARKKTKQ